MDVYMHGCFYVYIYVYVYTCMDVIMHVSNIHEWMHLRMYEFCVNMWYAVLYGQ